MNIEDLIRKLDSDLIVDSIEKAEGVFMLIAISQQLNINALFVIMVVFLFIACMLELLVIYRFKIMK